MSDASEPDPAPDARAAPPAASLLRTLGLDGRLPGWLPEAMFLAGDPAFELHLRRLESGLYTSIVTPGETFVVSTKRGEPFGDRMQRAVRDAYCVVYPLDARGQPVRLDFGSRTLVLRRKDLGCTPLVE